MNETNDEADLKMTRGKQELESSSSTAREKIFKIKKKKMEDEEKRQRWEEMEKRECGQIYVVGVKEWKRMLPCKLILLK